MLDLLKRFSIELATRCAVSTQPRFTIGHVSIFPESICPFCSQVIVSSRIWIFGPGKLTGWWDLTENGLVYSEVGFKETLGPYRDGASDHYVLYGHPHVFEWGAICMGDSHSEEEALFAGWNPENPVWAIKYWYPWFKSVWGHDCPNKNWT